MSLLMRLSVYLSKILADHARKKNICTVCQIVDKVDYNYKWATCKYHGEQMQSSCEE